MNINQISFKKLNKGDGKEFGRLVICYQNVFSDQPWNEFKKCSVCGNFWGRNGCVPEFCCGQPVVDFWQDYEILEKIGNRELTSSNIALYKEKIVGFSIGFAVSAMELEQELKLSNLSQIITSITKGKQDVAYQTDIGVRAEFRRLGIAKQLNLIRQADFKSMDLKLTTLRTKPDTVTYKWYTRYGYEVIAEYPKEDGRVILARKI